MIHPRVTIVATLQTGPIDSYFGATYMGRRHAPSRQWVGQPPRTYWIGYLRESCISQVSPTRPTLSSSVRPFACSPSLIMLYLSKAQ